jgi:hypothetical protein
MQKALGDALTQYADALGAQFSDIIAPLKLWGESTVQTMERVSLALTTVNEVMKSLGMELLGASVDGAKAAVALADAFGGLGQLQQATGAYYAAFYDEADRAARATQVVTTALADFGVAMPDSRDAFRAIVDGLDLTSEAGQRQFVTMMQVAGAFDEVTKYQEELAAEEKRRAEAELQRQKAIAEELTRKQAELAAAINENIDSFLSPQQRTDRSYEQIASSLRGAGLDITIDQLLSATKDQILEFVTDIVDAGEISPEAATAIVNAAGALGVLKDAAIEAQKALETGLQNAINENIGKFLTPAGRTSRSYEQIAGSLGAVGVDISADQLSGATKQQILDFATAFVTAGDASLEASIAVVAAAGALADLADAAVQTQAELERVRLTDAMQAIVDEFGDLSVIADDVETLSDAYVRNRNELRNLETGFQELLGNVGRTIQETLADMLTKQRELQAARSSLADAIENARLSGMTPENRVAALRGQEAALFGQIATAADPVAVAQRLQSVLIRRIQEEAGIRQRIAEGDIAALQTQADLAREARDAQIDALREQIDAAERLQQLSQDIFQTVAELRFSDISPRSFEQQLSDARGLFERTLEQATAGDEFAQRNLTGNARAYLDEARSYFASSAEYASIFNAVTNALESLGETGAGLDPQVAALNAQLEALRELNSKQSEVGEILIDTSADMTAGLLAIDAALAAREEKNAKAIEEQKELAQSQIDELRNVVQGQKDQIEQQVVIYNGLKLQLETLNEHVDKLLTNADLIMAAPA